MKRYRSIIAFVLALVAVFTINSSSLAAPKKASAYTPTQVEQFQKYTPSLQALRDRLPELAEAIQQQKWVEVGSLIHGPLGELRQKISYLTTKLLPKDQTSARETAKGLFLDLESIDAAAQEGYYKKAIRNYAEAVKDLDTFLQLIPKG